MERRPVGDNVLLVLALVLAAVTAGSMLAWKLGFYRGSQACEVYE